jgi:hypothetical protein
MQYGISYVDIGKGRSVARALVAGIRVREDSAIA